MGDISFKVNEKNIDNLITETLTNSAEYGIINQREFFSKDISNEKNLKNYYIVKPDDFVYNPRISNLAPVGPIKRNKLGRVGVMSPLYYVFRLFENIDYDYLEYYFQSTKWHKFMRLNGDSGARSDRFSIKNSVLITMPIPYPCVIEQYKIGKLFIQLNKMLYLHQRKIQILKTLYESFISQMYPEVNSDIPTLRYNNFNDRWTKTDLGNILKEFVCTSQVENQYKILSSTNSGMEYREGRVSGTSNKGYKIIDKGDLVLSPQNLWLGNININSLERGLVSPSYKTFKINTLDANFLEPQLRTKRMLKHFENVSTQGASIVRRNLDLDLFNQLQIKIPSNEEKTEISKLLASIKLSIDSFEKKLNSLQVLKKLYLSKMFL